jgi:hypothetical protein
MTSNERNDRVVGVRTLERASVRHKLLLVGAAMAAASATVLSPGVARAVPTDACQRASDDYGIKANTSWGFAPSTVRTWWTQNGCNTQPASSNSCQTASNYYGTKANITWGFAPTDVQTWWTSSSCQTAPAGTDSACQRASDAYGIKANVTWGFAPPDVKMWWTASNCSTAPKSSNTCQTVSNYYGTKANVTWGFAPADVQVWWTANNCTTSPQAPAAPPTGTMPNPPTATFGNVAATVRVGQATIPINCGSIAITLDNSSTTNVSGSASLNGDGTWDCVHTGAFFNVSPGNHHVVAGSFPVACASVFVMAGATSNVLMRAGVCN